MNNKILISLFAAIILLFVFKGVQTIDRIDSSFVDVVQEQASNIQDVEKVLDELQRFKEFLYCMNGLAVVIIIPVFMSCENRKSI
jgi:uncharacterized membrane protein